MQQDDRLVLLYVWNALIVFASMPFLTGAFFKSALAAAFVWVSCAGIWATMAVARRIRACSTCFCDCPRRGSAFGEMGQ